MDGHGTKKKQWDQSTSTWKEFTIWTVEADRELCQWLEKNYPNFNGWKYIFLQSKIVMEEPIYVLYCLKFSRP